MIKLLCRPTLLLLLPFLGGCDSLFYGFSIIPPEEPPRPPLVVDTAEKLRNPPVGDPAVMPLLTGAERSSVALITIQDRVPPHYHQHSDETIYILEGHGDLLLDQKWRPVSAGMLIHVPINVPHAYVNRAEGGSLVLATYTPGFTEGDRQPVQEARRR